MFFRLINSRENSWINLIEHASIRSVIVQYVDVDHYGQDEKIWILRRSIAAICRVSNNTTSLARPTTYFYIDPFLFSSATDIGHTKKKSFLK